MAQKISVTIIGLGRTGASIGLALQRYNRKKDAAYSFDINGVENRPAMLKEAEKLGAINRSLHNVHNAVRDRDIIILALPYADVRSTFQAMQEELRPGAVVIDFSPLKMPSIEWASTTLPTGVHLVGVSAVVNPRYLHDGLDDTEHAAEDYFDQGTIMLLPGPRCAPEAIELASSFASLLGADEHFMDPLEHDSLIAATQGLPSLLGVMAFYTLAHNQGWGDIQRLTNPSFGRLTHHLHDTHPDDLRDLWLNNRESLLHHLDDFIASLQQFRHVLAENDREAIEAVLVSSADEYSKWINKRHNNQWQPKNDLPQVGPSVTDTFLGGFVGRRLRGENNGE